VIFKLSHNSRSKMCQPSNFLLYPELTRLLRKTTCSPLGTSTGLETTLQ